MDLWFRNLRLYILTEKTVFAYEFFKYGLLLGYNYSYKKCIRAATISVWGAYQTSKSR